MVYKGDLLKRVAWETTRNEKMVADIVDTTFLEIMTSLSKGHNVVLPGFGVFYTRQIKGGKLKHPKTKKEVSWAAQTLPAFRAGVGFKKVVRARKK